MAGDFDALRRLEARHFTSTPIVRIGTAWVKAASRRRIERVRHFARHRGSRFARHVEVWNGVEGYDRSVWVLLDYFDFVVHIFHPTLRDYYRLERIWSDAKVVWSSASPGRIP